MKAVLAPHRNLPLDERRQRARMQNLRAVVSQLGRFIVGERVQHAGFADRAGIGAHDSVHIGPDPQLGGVQRGRENRRGEIRSAATQA